MFTKFKTMADGRKAPVLMALIVALMGLGGTAVAAKKLITGADIKNGSIASVDLSKSARDSLTGERGPKGRTGAAGAKGDQGAKGDTGPRGDTGAKGDTGVKGDTGAKGDKGENGTPGANGANAFDTIPTGTTVQGVVGLDVHNETATGEWGTLASLPMPAATVLGDDDVKVNIQGIVPAYGGQTVTAPTSTDQDDTKCAGTPTAPTAAPGTLCIYVRHVENATDLYGYGVDSKQGFKLNFTAPGAGDSFVDAVWAYTAA